MIEHTILDSATSEWLDAMREIESEGETSPAQVAVGIERGAFALRLNGESIGVSSQYRAMRFARQLLLAELGEVRS